MLCGEFYYRFPRDARRAADAVMTVVVAWRNDGPDLRAPHIQDYECTGPGSGCYLTRSLQRPVDEPPDALKERELQADLNEDTHDARAHTIEQRRHAACPYNLG